METIILCGSSARAAYLAHVPLDPVATEAECTKVLHRAGARVAAIRALHTIDRLRRCQGLAVLRDEPAFGSGLALPPQDSDSPVLTKPQPFELLVSQRKRRVDTDLAHARLWTGPMAPGSLCRVGVRSESLADVELYTVSPAFELLLECGELDLIPALLRGLELCGAYELRNDTEGGVAQRKMPLLAVEEFERLIRCCPSGTRGLNRARHITPLLVAGSASPRESVLLAMMTLPLHSGGFGLPKPQMNASVSLPQDVRKLLDSTQSIRFDLYWPEGNVALEYDSDHWHSDEARAIRDKNRQIVAGALGIDVIPVTSAALHNVAAMESIAVRVAAKLGRWMSRTPGRQILQRRERLFRLLLSG